MAIKPHNKLIRDATIKWVNSMVVGLNLCPFARNALLANRLRFVVTPACTDTTLLEALEIELELLGNASNVESTLLIHPHVLQNFTYRKNKRPFHPSPTALDRS